MVRIVVRDASGGEQAIQAAEGQSLMVGAKAAGVEGIDAECGGSMVCATCHVYLAEDWFARIPPAGEIEAEMVEYTRYPRATSRLSCQIMVTPDMDGMVVEVPPSQR